MKHDEHSFFHAYKSFWHPVAYAAEVTDKPVPVQLLGKDLMVWRADGKLTVTTRYCPHRGTDLVAGKLESDGIRCCFHGWKFGADGRCMDVPQLPPGSAPPEGARIKAFHTQERYGIVWTCLTNEPTLPVPEWPHAEADAPRATAPLPVLDWKTSAGRAIETFLDLGHLSWVHLPAFGNPAHTMVAPTDFQETSGGFSYRTHYRSLAPAMNNEPRKEDPIDAQYVVHYPFAGSLHFKPTYYYEHYLYLVCSPVSVGHMRGFAICSYDQKLKPVIARLAKGEFDVQQQDRAALEVQRNPIHDIDSDEEVHCAADEIHVRYRAGLKKLIDQATREEGAIPLRRSESA